jgi:hypothetical protein
VDLVYEVCTELGLDLPPSTPKEGSAIDALLPDEQTEAQNREAKCPGSK